jgi:hypothetical protein
MPGVQSVCRVGFTIGFADPRGDETGTGEAKQQVPPLQEIRGIAVNEPPQIPDNAYLLC